MPHLRLLRSEAGISLTEIMIGLGIAGAVLLGAAYFMSRTGILTQRLSNKAEEATIQEFAVQFIASVEGATPAKYFQHLPIPVGTCAEGKPCLRVWRDTSSTFETPSNDELGALPGVTAVEFFRDQNAALEQVAIFDSSSVAKNAMLARNKVMNISRSSSMPNFYVTWPLRAPSDPPFTFLSKAANGTVFTLDPALGSTTGLPGRTVFFTSSGPVDVSRIRNSLLLTYNTADLQQFNIQVVADALDCSKKNPDQSSVCRTQVMAINPAYTGNLLDGTHYALELYPIPEKDSGAFKAMQPSFDRLGLSGADSRLTWPLQSPDYYFFPTQVHSLSDSTVDDFTPAGQLNLRKLRHYYTMNVPNTTLVAVPVTLHSYSIEEIAGQAGVAPKRRLVAKTYDLTSGAVTEKWSELPGRVVFARKLGTSVVDLYTFEDH